VRGSNMLDVSASLSHQGYSHSDWSADLNQSRQLTTHTRKVMWITLPQAAEA
jgi:hypothetical protein